MPFIVLDESPCDSHGVWWIRRVLDLGTSRYLIGQKKDPIIWLGQLSYTHRHAFNYVDLFIWDQGGEQRQLYVELPHASFFVYELKQLDGIGNRTRVDDELKKKMADEVAKAKFSLAPGERLSPKTADAALIYISDFESTINHMLFKEMCAVEELHGARLDAVRSMVNAIGTYYKGRPAIMDLLGRINLLLGNLNQVDFNIITFKF